MITSSANTVAHDRVHTSDATNFDYGFSVRCILDGYAETYPLYES